MGTRGTFGVRIDGRDKLMYCQSDSYPDGWPRNVVNDIQSILKNEGIEWMLTRARELHLVDGAEEPAPEAPLVLFAPADLHQNVSSSRDWYALLRGLQGEFRRTLEVGLMPDAGKFICDGLYCEYGYIADLDEMTFEVYRGFQAVPHNKGRYADDWTAEAKKTAELAYKGAQFYYPCALVGTFPLQAIPEDWVERVFPGEYGDE